MSTTPPPEELLRTSARFQKSSRSSGAQDCVAVGHLEGLTYTGLRDTKNPNSVLAVTNSAFGAFLRTIKSGHYDR